MDKPLPFVDYFPDIYPQRRSVDIDCEPTVVGVLLKSIFYHKESLLCRGLVIRSQCETVPLYTTVNLEVTDMAPVVGYDLEMDADDGENWNAVKATWSRHFAAEPIFISVSHEDIKRTVNAAVFPLKSVARASAYMKLVRGALTFGDFSPDKGYYLARDGNTPALCSDVMFGRMYYIPVGKLNRTVSPRDLVYDHRASEIEARAFDASHVNHFYKAACLDIETVFAGAHRDPAVRSNSFAYRFPYCTEGTVDDMTTCRNRMLSNLKEQQKQFPKHVKRVSIPSLPSDMPGQQHEITCVSIVVLNSHMPKAYGGHRKKLLVAYNKEKAALCPHPELDLDIAKTAGIDDVRRVEFHACGGELALLERTISILRTHRIELLYVYNAEFDIRVLNQRVHFYADPCYLKTLESTARQRCEKLKRMWTGLFVTRALSADAEPVFQFENVRFLDMYREMLKNVGSVLSSGTLTEYKLRQIATHVETFNKDKAKLGHFKMNSCGMNVIDLYRMAGTRDIKYACTSMKLNDVAPYVVAKVREIHKKPAKDPRKLYKVADVSYDKMDEMISMGGKSLFAVLVYNLVDSQLCCRLAKVLKPVSALFHRCRTTLNIDVVVHGRGDMFSGFVQSIHSVQMPQLKFTLDTLRVKAGPVGGEHQARLRWDPKSQVPDGDCETWKGGAVCEPLTGLHYSGPGMGLELSFDFAGMYPSIMCALNISPETTIPWPPVDFPHDLSGWICYSWEAEGHEYASLILKYDERTGSYIRAPGVFASSVEYYLNQRSAFKAKLKDPAVGDAERIYFKLQEGECKVMANSFYGTAPYPCGPLISGHGRQQIAVVNNCVSEFYRHKCPVVYGDTDSVMVAVGYGPGDSVEIDVPDAVRDREMNSQQQKASLRQFAYKAQEAIRSKLKRVGEQVPDFLQYVHVALVEDVLKRMYVIGRDNKHEKLHRDPQGNLTDEGYPVYLARVPGAGARIPVTEAFVKDRRVKLEYENSCSIYCHVAKKTYLALTHTVDCLGEQLSSISVKVRGLAAFKSMRSPCDSAVTDTFISCVMKGDCVKLETDRVSCFSTAPWHRLRAGDVILYVKEEPTFDDESSRWAELSQASSFLTPHRVVSVDTLQLTGGQSAVLVKLENAQLEDARRSVYRLSLYKDGVYCMNHMFSRKESILRDLLAARASEMIASKMGLGLFPWSTLIKCAKNKHFSQHTLARLKVGNSNVKTTYVELTRTWLQRITGLAVKPVECYEFHKCNPCEATFYRYPVALQATSGCLTVMFGGSLLCESAAGAAESSLRDDDDDDDDTQTGSPSPRTDPGSSADSCLIDHPYQLGNKCYADSKVMLAHSADRSLVNRAAKLIAHCIIDFCLPRHMYSDNSEKQVAEDCKTRLLLSICCIKDRLKRANAAFNCIMNTCPEHMIPACGEHELDRIMLNRQHVSRLRGEKLTACVNVVVGDMTLRPAAVYGDLCRKLGESLSTLMRQGAISTTRTQTHAGEKISISLPVAMLREAGIASETGELHVSRNELHERPLVDLAGLLYQTTLMLQILNPGAFTRSTDTLCPSNTLCIMPYSMADETAMAMWIDEFKKTQWLTVKTLDWSDRRPGVPFETKQVSYHCTGCKNFYRDLLANDVPVHAVFAHVYGPDKTRKIGRCVNEKPWLLTQKRDTP